MTLTYHSGRRIQGLEYTASTLTTSGFAGTWGKDPSDSQFEVSNGKINFLDNTSSTGDRTWIDLQSIIGSAVSTTKWILRFKFNFSTLTSGTYYYEFDAGLSDTTVDNNTNQNFIGVRVLPSGFNNLWRPRTCDGSASPRTGSTANLTQSFSTGTDYYCEIKRTSSSNWSISLSTTDAYDGDLQDNSYTDASGATGLRYFKFGDAVTNSGSGFTMHGVCDVFEFYNDTNTIATASGDEKPTNVQVGSRFEETDTRKMYNLQELDNNVLYEDATGHSNTSSHGTVAFIGDNATYATLFSRITATNTTHPHPAANVDTPNKAFSSSDPWIIELTFKESYTIPSGSTITYNSYNNGQGARLKYLDFQVYTGSTWENITGTITNPNHSDGDVETVSGKWVKYMTSTTTTEKTGTKFRIRMWDSWDNYVTNGRHYIGGIELKIPIGNVAWQEIGA